MSNTQPRLLSPAAGLPGWYGDGRGYERWWDGERWRAPARPVQSRFGTPPVMTSLTRHERRPSLVASTVVAPHGAYAPRSGPRSFGDVPKSRDPMAPAGLDFQETMPRSLIGLEFERPVPPSKQKRRAVLLLPGIAAVFTLLGLLGLTFLGVLHRGEPARSVAERYLAASQSEDCGAIDDLVVADLAYLGDRCRSRAALGIASPKLDYVIGQERQASETTIAFDLAATADEQGVGTPARIELVRHDGEWLVRGMEVGGVEVLTPTK